jgi:hypothetical protein
MQSVRRTLSLTWSVRHVLEADLNRSESKCQPLVVIVHSPEAGGWGGMANVKPKGPK